MGWDAVVKFRKGVEYLRQNINTELPCQQIIMLLEIAEHEGVTMHDLAFRLNMTQGSIARNVKSLSTYYDHDKTVLKGHGLIETRPDLAERRKYACFLTKRGKDVMQGFANLLQNGPEMMGGDVKLT